MASKTPKIVLITGCSDGGIGASLASEFHARGCRVFATARNVEKMKLLAAKGIETIPLEVTNEASIAAAVQTVSELTSHKLDILINNAGINLVMPLADVKIEDLRNVFETNVIGAMAVTKAFIPLLAEAKGVVAMLGSITEVIRPCFQSAYSASKTALHVVASTLRVELYPMGIRVVTITTGAVKSNLMGNASAKLPKDSFYAPIAPFIDEQQFLEPAKRTYMETDKYAKGVVSDLLKRNPKKVIWRGGLATLARLLARFGWEGMLDSNAIKFNRLQELQK